MKKKLALLAIAGGMMVTSCKKTYECKDNQTEIITGEITASSQSEADKMCNQPGMNPSTATQK